MQHLLIAGEWSQASGPGCGRDNGVRQFQTGRPPQNNGGIFNLVIQRNNCKICLKILYQLFCFGCQPLE
jgi:hypothetical protein